MIVREYPPYLQSADEDKWSYFERWFIYVWRRHMGSNVMLLKDQLSYFQEELRLYNATIEINANHFLEVTFELDEDYTLFVLRWT